MPVQLVTLRVIAVISHATALVSQASSFRTQPAELELTMPSVIRWVCMGCQQPNRHGAPGPGSYFADYKSAACHYASSPACNKSNRGLRSVTFKVRHGHWHGASVRNSLSNPRLGRISACPPGRPNGRQGARYLAWRHVIESTIVPM